MDANGRGIALDKLQGPLVAVAGTAQPQAFFDMLRDRGLTLARVDALPDHADPSDYAHWHAELQQEFATNPVTVLCTEKDAFKLWTVCPGALAVPLVFELPQAFLDEFDRLLHAAFAAHLSSAYTH